MSEQKPTVVLVHGAFAESASWNHVIQLLNEASFNAVAAANPLRSLGGDAAYVRDVIAHINGPVVLVGHSYGGMVITEAAADNEAVEALVYVSAFAPDTGESALALSTRFPGSTLGSALAGYPVATGGNELVIRPELFHQQFAADVSERQSALMAATQRPVTEAALTDVLASERPAWKTTPSWFVIGEQDLNIPADLQRFFADRSQARDTRELAGGSHAIAVSNPDAVAASILDAANAVTHAPLPVAS